MIVPFNKIPSTTLVNLIKEFVLREGTDYGLEDASIEQKIEDVKRQLEQGTVVIVYSELHETINILPKQQFEQENIE